MLRELLRSTLYSSSRPFSSSATRDSSFSTLSMSLLPVLREERPKIFFTLSIIKVKGLTDQKRNCRRVLGQSLWSKVHRVPRRRLGGGGVGAGASQATCISNSPLSIASVRSKIRVAIGPATLPPCSPPCTITATTYLGLSNGAKQANHATVSLWPRSVAWAVPVFPATCTFFRRPAPPVPPSSLTTFQRPLRTSSI